MLARLGFCKPTSGIGRVIRTNPLNWCIEWNHSLFFFPIRNFAVTSLGTFCSRPGQCHRVCYASNIAPKFQNSKWFCLQRPQLLQLQERLLQTTTNCLIASSEEKLTIESDIVKKYLHSLLKDYESKAEGSEGYSPAEVVEANRLKDVISRFVLYQQKEEEITDLKRFIEECDNDKELTEIASGDLAKLHQELSDLESEIFDLLMPVDMASNSDVILEVSAGVGGQEAMLFTKEIFNMYCSYAAYKNWAVQIIGYEDTDSGGLRHATASISGQDVYRYLKFEGGVHRVQRVPKTEKSGRIHTSTMTVGIMPQPSEIDIVINMKDLKIETCRASGKGGQHVNTTDSAVRIVHIPTGTAAECQTERSQVRNRETALQVLRSRLYEKELEKQSQRQAQTRKLQMGSANRNEKIRTYNFKDDRVSDHRVGKNVYDVDQLLAGGAKLDELIRMLESESRQEVLLEKLQASVTN